MIEDKASLDEHIHQDQNGLLSQEVKTVKKYAVNGALFYALHLVANTSYNKVLAFGVSGNEKHHKITPIFVNERGDYQELSDVETFIFDCFSNSRACVCQSTRFRAFAPG